MNSSMESIFTAIGNETVSIQKQEENSYLESLLTTSQRWLDGQLTIAQDATREDMRKAIQLSILKGMKEHVQPHRQMTPDALGLLIRY
ncbi:class I SAM-dependent methyltransferase, partial [Planococcus sp. SIMBA_143]